MRMTEEKEVVKKSIEKVTTGRLCDFCNKEILPVDGKEYNYFYITTSHSDWVLGEELGDRCLRCPDCGCGIILRFYDMACGTMALNFCPYCGKKRKEAKAIGAGMKNVE